MLVAARETAYAYFVGLALVFLVWALGSALGAPRQTWARVASQYHEAPPGCYATFLGLLVLLSPLYAGYVLTLLPLYLGHLWRLALALVLAAARGHAYSLAPAASWVVRLQEAGALVPGARLRPHTFLGTLAVACPTLGARSSLNLLLSARLGRRPAGGGGALARAAASLVLLRYPEWWVQTLAELARALCASYARVPWHRKRLRAGPRILLGRAGWAVGRVFFARIGMRLRPLIKPGGAVELRGWRLRFTSTR